MKFVFLSFFALMCTSSAQYYPYNFNPPPFAPYSNPFPQHQEWNRWNMRPSRPHFNPYSYQSEDPSVYAEDQYDRPNVIFQQERSVKNATCYSSDYSCEGKVNVLSYNPIRLELVLISSNGDHACNIICMLNHCIYKPQMWMSTAPPHTITTIIKSKKRNL